MPESTKSSAIIWSHEDIKRVISNLKDESKDKESWDKFSSSMNQADQEAILEEAIDDCQDEIISMVNNSIIQFVISCKKEFEEV